MGSRLIESASYCNQILLAQLYTNSALSKARQLGESFGYCFHFYDGPKWFYKAANYVICLFGVRLKFLVKYDP